MATNCCYNLPFVTDIRTPGSGSVDIEGQSLMQFNTSQLDYNPAGNATLYMQSIATSIGTGAANRGKYVTRPGLDWTIKAATIIACTDGTLSSGEECLIEIVDENDSLLYAFTTNPTFGQLYQYIEVTGMSVSLTGTEAIRINWTTANWSVNPTLVCLDINLYLEQV